LLLKLVQKGLTREDGYTLVQKAAKKTWDDGLTLKEAVLGSKEIRKHLSEKEIRSTFDYKYHTKNVSKILKRVGIL